MASKMTKEQLAIIKELLIDAKYFYQYCPNSFRHTEEEYFSEYDELVRELEREED